MSFGGARGGVATIDLGTGDDHLFLYGAAGATTVTTGPGRDVIGFYWAYDRPVGSTLTVTDFTAGVGCDALSMTTLFGDVLTGWKGMHNPFTNGHVRLVQVGADTLVEYDAGGRGHADQFVTLVRLANVDATTLVADNLSGFAPDGSAPPGLRVDNGGSNLIDGGAGDDSVFHQSVIGGTGGGGGDETILLGDGYDWVRYQNFRSGSLTLDIGTGNDELDLYTVQDGGARITTGTGSDLIAVG